MNAELREAVEDLRASCGGGSFDMSAVQTADVLKVLDALRDQKAEIARLRGLLGQCYAISGADTDGDPPERHADYAVQAVTDLRRDYDDVLDWQTRCEKAEELLREFLAGKDYSSSEWNDYHARITAHLGGENNG